MCKHKYSRKFFRDHRQIGDSCPYPEIYAENRKKGFSDKENLEIFLPLDKDGVCLFHSQDLSWKRENNFYKKFLELLKILAAYESGKNFYNFGEFVFIGENKEESVKDSRLCLKDIKFKKEVYFVGAIFIDQVEINSVKFEGGSNFEGARFRKELKMSDVFFQSADFENAIFEKDVTLDKIDADYLLFPKAKISRSFRVSNSKIGGIFDFSEVIHPFDESNISVFKIEAVSFEGSTNFNGSSFENPVVFRNVNFYSDAEFIDTSFNSPLSTTKLGGYAVQFIDIEIKGAMIFESTITKNKMFNQEVEFTFRNEIEGKLIFKNVDFNKIASEARKNLILLSKTKGGKVEIGAGCIKYRYQTEIKTIEISEGNQILVLQLTKTFADYFTVYNGFNLGFEITNRNEKVISFFYFTDENIDVEEFLGRLKKTEESLFSLLNRKNPALLEYQIGSKPASKKEESTLLNTVDGISSLLNVFFRVGIRITVGAWKEKDTQALLESIHFNKQSTITVADQLHLALEKKISQTQIFNFFISNQFIEGDNIVNDKYEVKGQAGAVGPNSHAHDMTFNQIWQDQSKNLQLPILAQELARLRAALRKEEATAENDITMGALAQAETAAKQGDGPKTIEFLRSAGRLALSWGEKIGTGVVVAAIKAALGI